ncbi:AMP-dependent synthetase/ligase [Falsigemmobacter faecalis]|uniref:Long-chain fatty acid--CoA ligase n=1 Tax=Falsigemmobacter faecalis TaxID=2488730 RepID=A0A3P3DPT6_9RHOB|nr:AMP-binding protein [Falsigemmobacter faecalis]RRH76171.1 long-chain fatty acid--CoA ligase [Falsigemmobacter faecalis]
MGDFSKVDPELAASLFVSPRRSLAADFDPLSRSHLAAGEGTLPRLLREHARRSGAALALREKRLGVWRSYDWAHYYETARRFAFALLSMGVARGDRIIIASENTPEWYYADLGAEIIGAIPVGIYPTNPWPELQYIARHSGARLAVCGDQEQTDKVLDARLHQGGLPDLQEVLCVDMKGMRQYAQSGVVAFADFLKRGDAFAAQLPDATRHLDELIEATLPDDVALMVYTSGTTGPPKGAMLTHRNLIYSTYNYARSTGADLRGISSVGYLPLCHAAERCYSMAMLLCVGGTVNFAESIDTVNDNVREIAPTFMVGVPRIWEKMKEGFEFRLRESGPLRRGVANRLLARGRKLDDHRQANDGRLSAGAKLEALFLHWALFRNIQKHLGLDRSYHRLCGGASVSPETLRFFSVIGLPISQGYGMTEVAGCVFVQRPGAFRLGGCGLPVEGTHYKIAQDGEILLGGPAIFRGYFRDPVATEKTMQDGLLLSGDIVTELENGEISVIDRKKAIIITSGGKNIAPSEIENALKDSPWIREVIITGDGRKFLGALIQIDFDNVGRWAADRDLAYTTYKSLTQLPEVRALVQSVVDEVNPRFARVENIRRFVILEKELDHDDGELTATQKVRRSVIDTKFARELEEIYGKAEG